MMATVVNGGLVVELDSKKLVGLRSAITFDPPVQISRTRMILAADNVLQMIMAKYVVDCMSSSSGIPGQSSWIGFVQFWKCRRCPFLNNRPAEFDETWLGTSGVISI